MKTLILGIGNPILTDDAVGIRLAQYIGEKVKDVEIEETCEAGLALLDSIGDHEKLIIIDSIQTEHGKAGELHRFTLDDLKSYDWFPSSHGLDMATAFQLGKRAGYAIPQSISIYAVEVVDNTTFGEGCTEEIEKRIPQFAEQIIAQEKL